MTTPTPEPLPPLADSLVIDDDTALAYASAWVRAYCGWHIAPSIDDTVTLDTYGGRYLLLPTLHLTELGDVTLTDPDAIVVEPDHLTWSQVGLVALTCGTWPDGLATVTVDMTHGYDSAPDALAAVVVAVTKRLPAQFANVTAETAGGVSRQYGGLLAGQASLSAAFTAVELMVLDRYKLRARP